MLFSGNVNNGKVCLPPTFLPWPEQLMNQESGHFLLPAYQIKPGDYYSEEVDATYHVVYRDGRLSYSGHHIPTQVLVLVGPDTFRAGELTVRFVRSSPGAAATAFTIGAGRALNFRFQRR